ncbi:hypothetical protein [Flavobacterium soyae]|uniref:hypothetical protein n=1 Tax=Flavobacterium soyae TaxID=2903098 RepID=UPI001E3CED62|nr:hypothetical protein [Flavobacterium soyae]MCD9574255.1 hypothetical protein [Flavobacterium soyae]
MSVVLENIRHLIVNEGISVSKLEQIIGASQGVLSRAMSNNSDIQLKWILKLVENYPEYSCEWLLKNEGPMIRVVDNENFQISFGADEDEKGYKKLAEAQQETIESLKKVISLLEKQVLYYEKK